MTDQELKNFEDKHPWRIFEDDKPTGRRFTNAPCAAHSAYCSGGHLRHEEYGRFEGGRVLKRISGLNMGDKELMRKVADIRAQAAN